MPQVIQESVLIAGSRRLAGELAYSLGPSRALCLLVNPHPYMGGRMDNNVIARLASTLSAAQIITLRFDYGGVGSSDGTPLNVTSSMADFWRTGHAPIDDLMVEDAAKSWDWLRQQEDLPYFVVGYSFGAHVATRLAIENSSGVVLISPTIKHHNFDTTWPANLRKLVIHSDDDFATDADSMNRWFASLPCPKSAYRIPKGQHFFRGHEDDVANATLSFMNEILNERAT